METEKITDNTRIWFDGQDWGLDILTNVCNCNSEYGYHESHCKWVEHDEYFKQRDSAIECCYRIEEEMEEAIQSGN